MSDPLNPSGALLIPALSLAVASHECDGDLPELDYLPSGDPELVLTVPLAREVRGRRRRRRREHRTARPVATYWPDWYAKAGVPIIAL